MASTRLYLCLCLGQFPAQAYAACNPYYRKKPFVVVQQSKDSHKSLVCACSAPAIEIGIRPGAPIHELKRQYRHVEIVYRDKGIEHALNSDLSQLFGEYTPNTERLSPGSYLLDLSGAPFLSCMEWREIAERVRAEIQFKTQLMDISAGISRNKLLSKLLARSGIPTEILECPPGGEGPCLASIDVGLLPGLSRKCRERMKKYGIRKVGQIRSLGRDALIRRFAREGEALYSVSLGIDPGSNRSDAVQPILAETVMVHDINDVGLLDQTVKLTSDKLCHELRKRRLKTQAFTFVLTYADNRTTQRAARFSLTDDVSLVASTAVRVFRQLYQRRVAVKSIGLVARRTQADTRQLSLFETDHDRERRRLLGAVSKVRDKRGFNSIVSASYFNALR